MRSIIILFTFLFSFFIGYGQDFPEPMKPARIVNDFTNIFTSQQLNALETKLRHFNDTSSTQIAIATVPSLNGYDANDYAQRLAERWGVGQQGKDNGILIVVKPKTARENGQVAIAVGYGLEGVVPDAIASRIIRNEIIPEFQNDNYYAGIDKATTVLMDLSAGEYTADEYANSGGTELAGLFILFLFIFFILPLVFRKRRSGFTTDHTGSRSGPPFIFIGGPGRGGFGSSRGGGFGGGFGGFGGGSFGGGGASGSW
ncbi:MAG: TPM domain-containing protein [Odoribacter sp.]|nr:TPM domain-containing protein [Odoribacter sp.]